MELDKIAKLRITDYWKIKHFRYKQSSTVLTKILVIKEEQTDTDKNNNKTYHSIRWSKIKRKQDILVYLKL